jgi:hypothetical protein
MSGPKTVTVAGRLSYPTFTAKEAYDRSQKGKYPATDVASAKPDFQLLVTQAQWELFYNHVINEFFPYCIQQQAKGEKKDALDASEVAQLTAGLEDLSNQMFNTPAKPVYEKSKEMAPEAVATIKCIGPTGGDIELRAIVDDEDQLAVPDPDLLISKTNKKVLPLEQTKHRIYPGAYVASTLNLYAYHNGKHPGFSAGVSVAVFKANADPFGGSVAVDEDAIFMD